MRGRMPRDCVTEKMLDALDAVLDCIFEATQERVVGYMHIADKTSGLPILIQAFGSMPQDAAVYFDRARRNALYLVDRPSLLCHQGAITGNFLVVSFDGPSSKEINLTAMLLFATEIMQIGKDAAAKLADSAGVTQYSIFRDAFETMLAGK